jgi:hypothetical protein
MFVLIFGFGVLYQVPIFVLPITEKLKAIKLELQILFKFPLLQCGEAGRPAIVLLIRVESEIYRPHKHSWIFSAILGKCWNNSVQMIKSASSHIIVKS